MERSTLILDVFFEGPARLTLGDVVDSTGLPRSTTFRLLNQLVSLGWLSRDNYGYRLGNKILDASSRLVNHGQLRQSAHAILNELHKTTGGYVHLGVLEKNGWVHYLDRVGFSSHGTFASQVGARHPLEHTASGKAILAALPARDADRIIGRREYESRGDLSKTRAEVQKFRRLGSIARVDAVIDGNRVQSIAAPILGAEGPIGALAIGGIDFEAERLRDLVLSGANLISSRMYPTFGAARVKRQAPNVQYL